MKTCITCRGTGQIFIPPMTGPEPCPNCRPGLSSMKLDPPADDEIRTFPLLESIETGLLVKPVEQHFIPPVITTYGAVSVGPGCLPGVGPVVHIALHDGQGRTVMATLGAQAFAQFGAMFNDAARRIMSGEFDQQETVQ